ncbi:MAG: hypothetical protein ACI9XZ_002349 [Alphaproteobacteria bacterium]|jgi:hypothetical protein
MMPESSTTAQSTAISFLELYGGTALLHASLCAHQSLVANDISGCEFWSEVLREIEFLSDRNAPSGPTWN